MVIRINKLHVGGIALYPVIFIKKGLDPKRFDVLLNHEKIHLKQQIELLIVPFYLIYLAHYLVLLIRYKNHNKAYRNIIFEKEAFQNENDFDYLKKRKFWSFFKFKF